MGIVGKEKEGRGKKRGNIFGIRNKLFVYLFFFLSFFPNLRFRYLRDKLNSYDYLNVIRSSTVIRVVCTRVYLYEPIRSHRLHLAVSW